MCIGSIQFYFTVMCTLILSPAPQPLISVLFFLSPPNFSTDSITLNFSLVKDEKPSIRTHTPLCHTSFKFLYHFPTGKSNNWWYFHLSSLSMLHLGKRWGFQIAHYLFFTRLKLNSSAIVIGTQTSHYPIMFYEQFYNPDTVLSCPSERWLCELSANRSWKTG